MRIARLQQVLYKRVIQCNAEINTFGPDAVHLFLAAQYIGYKIIIYRFPIGAKYA